MCYGAEAVWVPAAVAALGAGVSAKTQNDSLKRQDQEAARGIMRQADIQRQAGARVNENIQNLKKSNPMGEEAAAQDQFMSALREAKLTGATNNSNFAATPGASGRFAEEVNGARIASGNEGTALAGRLARIDAPMYQRIREGQARGDTASKLSLLESDSANQDFLTRLRTASQRPNPWLLGAGSALQAGGSAMASRTPSGVKLTKRSVGGLGGLIDTPVLDTGGLS